MWVTEAAGSWQWYKSRGKEKQPLSLIHEHHLPPRGRKKLEERKQTTQGYHFSWTLLRKKEMRTLLLGKEVNVMSTSVQKLNLDLLWILPFVSHCSTNREFNYCLLKRLKQLLLSLSAKAGQVVGWFTLGPQRPEAE